MLIAGHNIGGTPVGVGPILVVDDDADVRTALDAALTSEGYDVVTAADGMSALRVATTADVALIILDLRMPVMDGREFVTRYAALARPPTPTIVLSAAQDAAAWANRIGADGYLTKPFDLDELLTLVARCVVPTRHD